MENEFINPEQPPKAEAGTDKQLEVKPEFTPEKVDEKVAEKATAPVLTAASTTESNNQIKQAVKDPQIQQIEDILADGLGDYYTKLNSVDQQKFKQSGEEAAKEVNTLLQKAAVKIEEIISVIRKWLGAVPGLNKFFAEQSAKIKADRIFIMSKKN